MASAWEFIRRLVSSRPVRAEQGSAADDAPPPAPAGPEVGEATGDEPPVASAHERLVKQVAIESLDKPEEDRGTDEAPKEEANSQLANEPAQPLVEADFAGDPDHARSVKTIGISNGTGTRHGRRRAKAAPITEPEPTRSNDLLELEEEISSLRRQLADRLKIQNAQLKEMLDRFDR